MVKKQLTGAHPTLQSFKGKLNLKTHIFKNGLTVKFDKILSK